MYALGSAVGPWACGRVSEPLASGEEPAAQLAPVGGLTGPPHVAVSCMQGAIRADVPVYGLREDAPEKHAYKVAW